MIRPRFFLISAFVLGLLTVIACKKGTVTNPVTLTIPDLLGRDSSLTLITRALQKVNLTEDPTYLVNAPYTFFAPDNSAMLRRGYSAERITSMHSSASIDSLRNWIKYLFVRNSLNSNILLGFFSERVLSLYPDSTVRPYLTENYNGLFINGVKVVRANIQAGNGTLQVIDDVPFPPYGNLYQTIKGNRNLKDFTAVLIDSLPLIHELLTTDTCTFFAPSDSAWRARGFATVADVLKISKDTLTADFLFMDSYDINKGLLHDGSAIHSFHYTPEFFGGYEANGELPGKFAYINYFNIAYDGLHLLENNLPQNRPYMIHPNISALNGVLHITDRVFNTFIE